jgi:signal transduction histidine kinase
MPGPELLELNDVVGGLHDLMSASIGRHIDLRIETEAGLPPFVADGVEIEQVLLNLAVNARDAMPDGGT